MDNRTILTQDILKKIKQLAADNYNSTAISREIGYKRQTIDYWIKKFNIKVNKRRSRLSILKEKKFIEICKHALENKETIKFNETITKHKIHPSLAQNILKEHPEYKKAIRTKAQSAIEDKTLSLKEAQSRLPNQTDKIIGFKNGKYKIQSIDAFVYYKTSTKLYQGDPRGKSGRRLTKKYITKELKSINYELIQDSYTKKRNPLSARCLVCDNIRTNRFDNFFNQRCPTCSNNGSSRQEEEVNKWIKSLGFQPRKFRFKGKTRGKEIDIYIPSLRIGIEYCGLYWHTIERLHNKNYHYNKMKQAEDNDIRLVTLFEDEWLNKQEQVKNFLKSILNVYDYRIYARKCRIKIIQDKKITMEFLEKNHIQGRAPHKISIGLYYESQLVGLITGNRHHRKNNESLVLNRLVFKDGYQIVGGASKLLKYLKLYAKNEGYSKLISWSDNRWSQGNVYKKIGFLLEEELNPDYSYIVNSLLRESKQSNTKKNLIKKGACGTMNNTERELSKTLGYKRLYDCGKKRWSMKLNIGG